MKKFILLILAIVFALPVFAATDMPLGTGEAFLKGEIDASGKIYAVFYDTDGSGACMNTTYDTYVSTNATGVTTGYGIHVTGSYTTASSGSTAWIQSESFSSVTSLVTTLSTATMTDADCMVYYYDTDASSTANTGDKAIYKTDITSISPVTEDVTITHPGDAVSTALVRLAVP